jgi:hypothetical protein
VSRKEIIRTFLKTLDEEIIKVSPEDLSDLNASGGPELICANIYLKWLHGALRSLLLYKKCRDELRPDDLSEIERLIKLLDASSTSMTSVFAVNKVVNSWLDNCFFSFKGFFFGKTESFFFDVIRGGILYFLEVRLEQILLPTIKALLEQGNGKYQTVAQISQLCLSISEGSWPNVETQLPSLHNMIWKLVEEPALYNVRKYYVASDLRWLKWLWPNENVNLLDQELNRRARREGKFLFTGRQQPFYILGIFLSGAALLTGILLISMASVFYMTWLALAVIGGIGLCVSLLFFPSFLASCFPKLDRGVLSQQEDIATAVEKEMPRQNEQTVGMQNKPQEVIYSKDATRSTINESVTGENTINTVTLQ